MKKKLENTFPFLDQGIAAAFNFLFVLVTSFILPTDEFVKINYIMLMVLLMLNVHNALVFQPFLKFFSASSSENIKGISLNVLLKLNLASILIFAGTFYYLKISLSLFVGAVIWLFILSFYEFNRRISMLNGKWNNNFFIGLLLNLITWPAIYFFKFDSAKVTLLFIISAYFLVSIIFTLINFKYYWKKIFFAKPKGINDIKRDNEFYKFGILLLGGSVAFWFISGGYLLYLGKFLLTNEIAFLRVLQNLFNGIWIILTALDNVILSGSGYEIFKKIKSVRFLAIVSIFTALYGTLVYLVFRFFYDFDNITSVLLIWILFYLILSFAKIYMSLLKFMGESKSVFISQGIGVAIYFIMVTIINGVGVELNIINVSFLWVPISLIILLICNKDLKRLNVGEKYE